MSLVIISPTRIELDGKDAGLPGTWLVANPGRLNEFNTAMVAWHQGQVMAEQAKDAEVQAAKDAAVSEVAAAREEAQAAIAEHEAKVDEVIQAAGGVEAVDALLQQRAAQAKEAKRAEYQQAIADLDKPAEDVETPADPSSKPK